MPIKKSELYSSLWQSCDELRGSMDASQYKDYVLVLLFVKYVSDRYAGQPDALILPGPARALNRACPDPYLELAGYRDDASEGVAVLQTARAVTSDIAAEIARACRLAPEDLGVLLDLSEEVMQHPLRRQDLLRGEIIVIYMDKPSTRTRLSFDADATVVRRRVSVVRETPGERRREERA